jgi:16S rRNA processing protein RimM
MNTEVVSKENKNAQIPSKTGAATHEAVTQPLIALAKIGRPYGLTGAIRVFPYSNEAAVLRRAKSLVIRGKSHTVESMRVHGDSLVAVIEGVSTPEQAASFTNAEVFVSRDAFPPLPKGEFYWVDLIGLDCLDLARAERSFGQIVEVFEAGAHPILRVRPVGETDDKRDELIPFVDAIVRSVDMETRRVDVDWEGSE